MASIKNVIPAQATGTIVMVRPVAFRMNEQTAVNNYFQEDLKVKNAEINRKAQAEFDAMVNKLKDAGIEVLVLNDDLAEDTPDSIFPNNWVSTHANGDIAIYPMYAENRRRERRDAFFILLEEHDFEIKNIVDYTKAEEEGIFLEGTGSIVLDRANEKAYCALSARADEELFIEYCEEFEYFPVVFNAFQTKNEKRLPIYHTNVMMCVAEDFCVICLECIDDKKERKNVVQHLKDSGKEIIAITEKQLELFAGNMLQLMNEKGEKILAMSQSAHNSLSSEQISRIEKYCKILSSDLTTIETCGGGSARCMMAEIFLPKV
ncbi:citrulline utilization hydrolase CtlX [Flavimarina sp. Hel_I_48]|uniref:citrulline utilization hydrolase CtlX n=1 Tax=Flavimarina sp. Hel_I_48 TaxID=1392488 RepID=UPI0004DF46D7|nr:arginine deiminase-related protein [Flavimarina sp. Hel_I_48]